LVHYFNDFVKWGYTETSNCLGFRVSEFPRLNSWGYAETSDCCQVKDGVSEREGG
jgi:hypothetical protein